MTSENNNKIKLLEAMVLWCDPHRPNSYSGKIQTEAVRLNDAAIAQLQEDGITVNVDNKNDPNSEEFKGSYIKLKSDAAVPVRDMEGKDLPDTLFIGNGSVGVLAYRPRPWSHKQSGRSDARS